MVWTRGTHSSPSSSSSFVGGRHSLQRLVGMALFLTGANHCLRQVEGSNRGDRYLSYCDPNLPPTFLQAKLLDCSSHKDTAGNVKDLSQQQLDQRWEGETENHSPSWIPEGFCYRGLDKLLLPAASYTTPLPNGDGTSSVHLQPVPFTLAISAMDICPTLENCLVCGDWMKCDNIPYCGVDQVTVNNVLPVESICLSYADAVGTNVVSGIVGDTSSVLSDPVILEFCQHYYEKQRSSILSPPSFSHVCFVSCDPFIIVIPTFEPRGENAEYHQGGKPYLGANTNAKRAAIPWISRVSALLSFLGATFILVDVLSNTDKRKTVYHQLLAMMACFDLVTAVAWSLASAAIPQKQASNTWIRDDDWTSEAVPDHVKEYFMGQWVPMPPVEHKPSLSSWDPRQFFTTCHCQYITFW